MHDGANLLFCVSEFVEVVDAVQDCSLVSNGGVLHQTALNPEISCS